MLARKYHLLDLFVLPEDLIELVWISRVRLQIGKDEEELKISVNVLLGASDNLLCRGANQARECDTSPPDLTLLQTCHPEAISLCIQTYVDTHTGRAEGGIVGVRGLVPIVSGLLK